MRMINRRARPRLFKGVNDMDVNGITTLITNVGFPVAVAAALLYYNLKESERHKDEAIAWTEILANNTKVLEGVKQTLDLILQKLGSEIDDGK